MPRKHWTVQADTRPLILTVNCGTENAAFEEGNRAAECARILRAIADKLDAWTGETVYQTILDLNGNDVGRWKLGPNR